MCYTNDMRYPDTFASYHPSVNFLYFASVLLFGMWFMHPVCLAVSVVCAVAYNAYLNGEKSLRFCLVYMLPMLCLAPSNCCFVAANSAY